MHFPRGDADRERWMTTRIDLQQLKAPCLPITKGHLNLR